MFIPQAGIVFNARAMWRAVPGVMPVAPQAARSAWGDVRTTGKCNRSHAQGFEVESFQDFAGVHWFFKQAHERFLSVAIDSPRHRRGHLTSRQGQWAIGR